MTRILGIDLGTTNSALATAGDGEPAHALPVVQVVGPGEIAERATLPSFLLLPGEQEVAPPPHPQPGGGPRRKAVGPVERARGAQQPPPHGW